MKAYSQDPRDITRAGEANAVRVTFWDAANTSTEDFRLLDVSGYDELTAWIDEHRDGREVVVQLEIAHADTTQQGDRGTHVLRIGPETGWA